MFEAPLPVRRPEETVWVCDARPCAQSRDAGGPHRCFYSGLILTPGLSGFSAAAMCPVSA